VINNLLEASVVRKGILLSWFTILYNLLEGFVSIYFGTSKESIALAGFGFDSFIEVGSALLVLWRLKHESFGDSALSIERERSATFGIGILFLLLALVVGGGSVYSLYIGGTPDTTLPGLAVSSLSISFMFWLYYSKKAVAQKLNSATVMKDASCSMACIKISFVLFAGSLIFILFPSIWWADSVAAIVLCCFIALEGFETVKTARSPNFAGGCGCVTD